MPLSDVGLGVALGIGGGIASGLAGPGASYNKKCYWISWCRYWTLLWW